MADHNTRVARRLVEEVWNRGNFAVVDEHVASDYVGHSSMDTHGREGYKQFYAMQRAAFPDIRYAVDDLLADGDRVAIRWTARGTHTGEFQGIPPTHAQGTVTGITIFRVASDHVVECWTNADELGMLRQLGVLPTPERVGP